MVGAPSVAVPPGGFGADRGFQGRAQAGGLGLGLGLNRFQRGRFLEAAQGGNAQDYLSSHPLLQQRIANRVGYGTPQAERLSSFMQTGQAPSGAELRYGPRQPDQGAGLVPQTPDIDRGMTPEESGAGTMDRQQAREQLQTARQGRRQDVLAARQQARPAIRQARQQLRGMGRGAGGMAR